MDETGAASGHNGSVPEPGAAASGAAGPRVGWSTVFLFGVGALGSTILLKVAQVQYLELLYLAQIGLLLAVFAKSGFRAVVYRPLLQLGAMYGLFCVAALALAAASLRFDFYMPPGLSRLQYPFTVALARTVELVLDAFGMLYLAGVFRWSEAKTRFTMRVYFWTGFASAVYGVLSYPLLLAGAGQFGAYGYAHRVRGFYNEGGPYGLYAVTLYYVGIALYRQGWERRRRVWMALGVVSLALLLSASKAAFAMLLALMLVNALLAQGWGKRVAILGGGAAVLVLFTSQVNVGRQLRLLEEQGQRYERLSQLHRNDGNFVQGRVAGVFIVPRMVEAHPWTGVGWGNYGITRNDPQYRGASAWSDLNDEPGLGLLSMASELGIPLLLLLLACTLMPYLLVRSMRAPAYVANLALVQPMAQLFGAQLNLTYPWIVSAFAMGLAFYYGRVMTTGAACPILDESKPKTTGLASGRPGPGGPQGSLTGSLEGTYG